MGRVVEIGVQRKELRGLFIVPVIFLSNEKLKRRFTSFSITREERFEVEFFSRGGE